MIIDVSSADALMASGTNEDLCVLYLGSSLQTVSVMSVLQCESKKLPLGFSDIYQKFCRCYAILSATTQFNWVVALNMT